MKYRKFLIAWSVAWGVVALLSVGLWARSYRWSDEFWWPQSPYHLTWFKSVAGGLLIIHEISTSDNGEELRSYSEPVTDWREAREYFYGNLSRNTFAGDPGPLPSLAGFSIGQTPVLIMFPHWFPALIAIAIATAPWIRWPKRYRLRTVFTATTLIAVVLGIIVWMSRTS